MRVKITDLDKKVASKNIKSSEKIEKVSLLQTVEPEYEIKVGIKDDCVISVDWLAMMQKGKQIKGYRSKLIKYLEQAISILKSAGFGK